MTEQGVCQAVGDLCVYVMPPSMLTSVCQLSCHKYLPHFDIRPSPFSRVILPCSRTANMHAHTHTHSHERHTHTHTHTRARPAVSGSCCCLLGQCASLFGQNNLQICRLPLYCCLLMSVCGRVCMCVSVHKANTKPNKLYSSILGAIVAAQRVDIKALHCI